MSQRGLPMIDTTSVDSDESAVRDIPHTRIPKKPVKRVKPRRINPFGNSRYYIPEYNLRYDGIPEHYCNDSSSRFRQYIEPELHGLDNSDWIDKIMVEKLNNEFIGEDNRILKALLEVTIDEVKKSKLRVPYVHEALENALKDYRLSTEELTKRVHKLTIAILEQDGRPSYVEAQMDTLLH